MKRYAPGKKNGMPKSVLWNCCEFLIQLFGSSFLDLNIGNMVVETLKPLAAGDVTKVYKGVISFLQLRISN